MDVENEIQKCSTCGEAFIAGVVNGNNLKIAEHAEIRGHT